MSGDVVSSVVEHYAGKKAGDLSKKGLDAVSDKLIPELKSLRKFSEIDSNGIFYNGLKKIQNAIDEIRLKIQSLDSLFLLIIWIGARKIKYMRYLNL